MMAPHAAVMASRNVAVLPLFDVADEPTWRYSGQEAQRSTHILAGTGDAYRC